MRTAPSACAPSGMTAIAEAEERARKEQREKEEAEQIEKEKTKQAEKAEAEQREKEEPEKREKREAEEQKKKEPEQREEEEERKKKEPEQRETGKPEQEVADEEESAEPEQSVAEEEKEVREQREEENAEQRTPEEVLHMLSFEEVPMEEPRLTWEEMSRIYPSVRPFGDADSWEVLRIRLQDIGRLPREYWGLGQLPLRGDGISGSRQPSAAAGPGIGAELPGSPRNVAPAGVQGGGAVRLSLAPGGKRDRVLPCAHKTVAGGEYFLL